MEKHLNVMTCRDFSIKRLRETDLEGIYADRDFDTEEPELRNSEIEVLTGLLRYEKPNDNTLFMSQLKREALELVRYFKIRFKSGDPMVCNTSVSTVYLHVAWKALRIKEQGREWEPSLKMVKRLEQWAISLPHQKTDKFYQKDGLYYLYTGDIV